jgi:hypothetical protein
VLIVVAQTPTRRRGMSTPSDTMRTATIQGSAEPAKRAMRVDDIGSSDTATVALTPQRYRRMSAMPWAWSWSAAMTRPPASGCDRRIVVSRSFACSSTVGSHSPSRLRAVRRRWAEATLSSASSKPAAATLPSGATHSMNPLMRGK